MIAKFSSEPMPRPPETTIFALVSSGRSEAATLSSTHDETPGSAAAGAVSIGAGACSPVAREARAADGDHLRRVRRLHRLHGVAGIDRPLEGVGPGDGRDVGDHHDVEQRREPRRDVLARGRRREDDVRVALGHPPDEVGQRLGEAVAVALALDMHHLRDPVELRRRFRDRGTVVPRDEHGDVAAHRLRRSHGLGGGVVQRAVVVLGQDQDRHQITPASDFSLAISSSTEPTLTPAWRVDGSTVFTTFSRGVTSTP